MRIETSVLAKAPSSDSRGQLSKGPLVDDEQSVAIPDTLPILPIRNLVLFPGTVFPLTIGREGSRKLLEESLPQSKIIGIFTQKNPEHDNPSPEELQRVGVAASVLKLIRQSDESVVIIINGLERIAIRKVLLSHPFIRAEVEVLRSTPPPDNDPQWQATVQQLRESALQLIELTPDVPEQAAAVVRNLEDPGRLADLMAGSLNLDPAQKQDGKLLSSGFIALQSEGQEIDFRNIMIKQKEK